MYKRPQSTIWETIKHSLHPSDEWGPSDPSVKKEWEHFRREKSEEVKSLGYTRFKRILRTFVPSK